MQEYIDFTHRRCLHFDGEKVYFDDDKDDLLDKNEEIFMMDTRGSLPCEQLVDIVSQDVGVGEVNVLYSTQYLLSQLREKDD